MGQESAGDSEFFARFGEVFLPRVSPDGKYIFFKAYDDVYWVDAAIADELKPERITAEKK